MMKIYASRAIRLTIPLVIFPIVCGLFVFPKTVNAAGDNIYGAFDVPGTSCEIPKAMSVEEAGLLAGTGSCMWLTNDPTERSTTLWGGGQKWVPGKGLGRGGAVGNFYVPYTGEYRMRMHFCPSNKRDKCTISKATQTMDTVNKVTISSAERINAEERLFGGYSGVTAVDSNACYALVDSSGAVWTGGGYFMCSDGNSLPSTPATCYLNHNSNLDVNMGNLERSAISTAPMYGATGNLKKTVSVLCTRDAGTTVSTAFQFTTLTFNGQEVVSTSSAHLGVAIFYKGKLFGPSSEPVIENFEVGYTDRELEFQAVRDPNVELKEIPTGNFTASAVMIMTEQ